MGRRNDRLFREKTHVDSTITQSIRYYNKQFREDMTNQERSEHYAKKLSVMCKIDKPADPFLFESKDPVLDEFINHLIDEYVEAVEDEVIRFGTNHIVTVEQLKSKIKIEACMCCDNSDDCLKLCIDSLIQNGLPQDFADKSCFKVFRSYQLNPLALPTA